MASTAQVTANIANAQKSSGPKTEKGKHRTRLNAYRHGLTGQICLLTADEHEAFEQHCAIEKNMAQLHTLRAERQAARQQALEEAQLLAQLAQSKGEKYDPARDFPPEILQIGPDFSSLESTA